MPFELTLQPSGNQFTVPEGTSILKAGHDADIALPYSCRAGACRTCRGRIVEGQIDHGHVHPTYLPLEEREQGYALLCQAQPLSNLVIEVKELAITARIRSRVSPGRVMEMRRVAPDVVIVRIKLPMNEDVIFLAGQFVEFVLANGERRAYSIASAPSISGVVSIELHVRHTPGGLFTDYVFDGMQVHDLVRMELPLGTFFLREDSDEPIVLLASGTGFAPMKSILQYAQQKQLNRPMQTVVLGRPHSRRPLRNGMGRTIRSGKRRFQIHSRRIERHASVWLERSHGLCPSRCDAGLSRPVQTPGLCVWCANSHRVCQA